MIKNGTLGLIVVLVCLLSTSTFSQTKLSPQDPPVLTFENLRLNFGIKGTFSIHDAYVIEIHKCPPCPPGAQCKPSLGDYVVVTDNIDEKDPLLTKRLRVFTGTPERLERFVLKKKYSFIAKVRGKVPSGKPIEDLDLLEVLLYY